MSKFQSRFRSACLLSAAVLLNLLAACQSPALMPPAQAPLRQSSVPVQFQSSSQSNLRFPQDWKGVWKGSCSNTGPAGKQTYAPVDMRLTIQPETGSANWQWRIEYLSAQENQLRDYTLKAVDAAKGHWLIDEHNGILLDNFMVRGNLILEQFSVGQTLLFGRHELQSNPQAIKVELVSFALQNARQSGAEPYPVSSFKLLSTQECLLRPGA